MLRITRLRAWAVVLAAALGTIGGCEDGQFTLFQPKQKPPPPEKPPEIAADKDPLLDDTIGRMALIADSEPLRLRGFGVVVGLGDTGGTDCPETVRQYLIDFLTKEMTSRTDSARPLISPQRLLDSSDASVVEIQALVPPGAPAGATFDVQVQAVGTQTQSIAGGMLLPCELKVYDLSATGDGLISGKTLARARGPIFTNPFQPDSPDVETRSPRRGYVLGGGRTAAERTVRVMLTQPSYSLARRMENRLNERFGRNPPCALAMSQGYLVVKTLPQFAADPERFLDVAMHLPIENAPAANERKLRELGEEVGDASVTQLDHIALVWEAIGKPAIPAIQPLYDHPRLEVRYHAARAGLRLGDSTAVPALAALADEMAGDFGTLAARELARSDLPAVVGKLFQLLDSPSDDRRISAYEGLIRQRHPAVQSFRFPAALDASQTALTLDVVHSKGRPLVYVRRRGETRIAVFGATTPLILPMFYSHRDELVTVNAEDAAGEVTLFGRTRASRRLTDRITSPPRVVELIRAMAALPLESKSGEFAGLGLPYTPIVETLDALCRNSTIPARLVLERAQVVDLLGPRPTERPEADPVRDSSTDKAPAEGDATSSAPAEKERPE